MAPYVALTYVKSLAEIAKVRHGLSSNEFKEVKSQLIEYYKTLPDERVMNDKGFKETNKILSDYLKSLSKKVTKKETETIRQMAYDRTYDESYQAMEAFIANMNTLHSRAGSQVPFSSINLGTDTSTEGRIVIETFLLNTEAGLGNGETAIFPISIFKMKDGVNVKDTDPNKDLWKLACRVSAKRLFPNFSNLDVDYNAAIYDGTIDSEIAYMGCRTRVATNVYDRDREIVTGRGNLSFTSINLPRLALESNGNIELFFEKLEDTMYIVRRQLKDRLSLLSMKTPMNFPFLMGQGIWIDSDKLEPREEISDILKHGTLTVGFIGLAETLIALTGKHHGESEESNKLGLKIVNFMRELTDAWSLKDKLNFSVIATPAEGLSGRFVRIDKDKFGIVDGVTDKDYYTNSFHVPVYYPIGAIKKIKIEADYHRICNGGHITYVELDGDPSNNLEAFEDVVMAMYKYGIGYGAINHQVDRDPVCGYTGIIGDECPRCHRKEGEPMTEEQFRIIKGFANVKELEDYGLIGTKEEIRDRVSNHCISLD